MSILFRCPCGRSMVADSDKAGAIVTCPNCRRRLRVPSGKDRGVEIPASPAATRTLRRCPRCGHDVPIDSQTCPHCQADLRGGPAAGSAPAEAGPSAPATADASLEALKRASARRPAADTRGIVLGGYRGNWFTRLTPGGRAGVVIGAVVFLLLAGLLVAVAGSSYLKGQLRRARETARANLARGRQLETEGKFQEAYDLYAVPTDMLEALRQSPEPGDADLAAELHRRAQALQYLVPRPKVAGSVYWKPQTQAEFDEAMAHLKATYPAYRQLCLTVAEAGLAAVRAGKEGVPQNVFREKVAATVEAFVRLVDQTTKQQRSQITFAYQLTRGLAELGKANLYYGTDRSKTHLTSAEQYFLVLKERVSMSGYPDAILNQ